MKEAYEIILRPLLTEKSTRLKDEGNQYVFEVRRDANKIEIKNAVEKLFNVKVLSVKTINMKGKKKRVGRFQGKKSDWKKAIVKLSAKDSIPVFEGV